MSRTLFSLAGFQAITIGRFWVIAEDREPISGRKIHAFDRRAVSASMGRCQGRSEAGAGGRGSEHAGYLVFPPRETAQAPRQRESPEAVSLPIECMDWKKVRSFFHQFLIQGFRAAISARIT